MKGLISKGLAVVCATVALTTGSGCLDWLHPRQLWDPCWPQRYAYQARQSVLEGMGGQVYNGHVLDQTVWNFHFEPGSDRLTPGGLEHLAYLARRRPCPDPVVYLQTAQDVAYDPAAPEKFVEGRYDLNARRAASVQKYLSAVAAGKPVNFDVIVHDPADVGMSTIPMGLAVQRMYAGSQGLLPLGVGGGATNVSGGGGVQ
jgi:hypothetical protein